MIYGELGLSVSFAGTIKLQEDALTDEVSVAQPTNKTPDHSVSHILSN